MAEQLIELLRPRPGQTFLDLTLGLGGHAERLLDAEPGLKLIGLDRDPYILEHAAQRLARFGPRVRLERARLDQAAEVVARLGQPRVDGLYADLGVSSPQLDEAERGFSFDRDGPLDMRMDPGVERSAADVVNQGGRDELLHAIGTLGEEPAARRIVDAILKARAEAPLRRTCELAELVARQVGGRQRHHHPATRTFLGLRLLVNDELGSLERGLPAALELLSAGGRAVVIVFHGGEERVVRRCFRDAEKRGLIRVLTRKALLPSGDEVEGNPRARSARARAAERTGAVSGRP